MFNKIKEKAKNEVKKEASKSLKKSMPLISGLFAIALILVATLDDKKVVQPATKTINIYIYKGL